MLVEVRVRVAQTEKLAFDGFLNGTVEQCTSFIETTNGSSKVPWAKSSVKSFPTAKHTSAFHQKKSPLTVNYSMNELAVHEQFRRLLRSLERWKSTHTMTAVCSSREPYSSVSTFPKTTHNSKRNHFGALLKATEAREINARPL